MVIKYQHVSIKSNKDVTSLLFGSYVVMDTCPYNHGFFVCDDWAIAWVRKNCSTSVKYAILLKMGYKVEFLDSLSLQGNEGFHTFAEKTLTIQETPHVTRTIMITRHPISRLLSAYHKQKLRLGLNKDISFEYMVDYLYHSNIIDPHFIPQTSYRSYRYVKEFIRMETELDKLPIKLPIKNKTRSYKVPAISCSTKQLIYEIYQKDFEVFGYEH
jgi:hypothetical protein